MTPLQLAGAAVFASEVLYAEPCAVSKIVTQAGEEDLSSEPIRAMEDYTAYMITDNFKRCCESYGEPNVILELFTRVKQEQPIIQMNNLCNTGYLMAQYPIHGMLAIQKHMQFHLGLDMMKFLKKVISYHIMTTLGA